MVSSAPGNTGTTGRKKKAAPPPPLSTLPPAEKGAKSRIPVPDPGQGTTKRMRPDEKAALPFLSYKVKV